LVTGPKSPAIVEALTDENMAQDQFGWLTHRAGKIAGVDVHLIRVSFAGEAGWEMHIPMAKMETVFDAIMAAGAEHQIKPFGMLALDSMRLEKGYRSWKSDLTSDYTMLESGLSRWVRTDKGEFIGRAAIMAEQQRGVARRFVTMVLDDADASDSGEALYLSSIRSGGKDVGLVVSAGYGHRVGKSIAYGVVDENIFSGGSPNLEIEVLGQHRQAHLVDSGVLYDADNSRLKG